MTVNWQINWRIKCSFYYSYFLGQINLQKTHWIIWQTRCYKAENRTVFLSWWRVWHFGNMFFYRTDVLVLVNVLYRQYNWTVNQINNFGIWGPHCLAQGNNTQEESTPVFQYCTADSKKGRFKKNENKKQKQQRSRYPDF